MNIDFSIKPSVKVDSSGPGSKAGLRPTTPKPELRAPTKSRRVEATGANNNGKKKGGSITTVEKTKQALAPKANNFAVMRYSICLTLVLVLLARSTFLLKLFILAFRKSVAAKKESTATQHDVGQMLNLSFSNPDQFYDAVFKFFETNSFNGW